MTDFGIVLLFILAGIAFLSLMLIAMRFIRPNSPNDEKLSTYESGEEPIGTATVQFNIRFYFIALVFLLFEVELLFLFPWAVVFGQKTLIQQSEGLWARLSLIEMIIFVLILALGLAYAWVKGYLDWQKPNPKITEIKSKVPKELYERLNERFATPQNNIQK